MTIPFYCLVAMLVLILATKIPLGIAQVRAGGGKYDNRDPRTQQAALSGWGKRALAAHQNTFEALAIFTPAVLISHFAPSASSSCAATLAVVHVVARVIYPVLYIADVHVLRSLVWGVGFGAAIWMALLPAL